VSASHCTYEGLPLSISEMIRSGTPDLFETCGMLQPL
jgi:hypothetical protein